MLILNTLNESTSHVDMEATPTSLFNENFDFTAMGVEMMVESERSWNRLNRMTGEANCAIIHESITNPAGVAALTEGAMTNFFTKVKEFFKKMWGMVQEMFGKFMMWINSKLKSEKEFITKYKKEIITKITALGEIEVKGYKYTIPEVNIVKAADMAQDIPSLSEVKAEAAKMSDDEIGKVEEELEASTIEMVLEKKVDRADFNQELHDQLRNGQDTKEDITIKSAEVQAMISELETYADTKKVMDKTKAAMDKSFKKTISDFEKLEKELFKEDKPDAKTSKYLNALIAGQKTMHSILSSAVSGFLAALKERADFNKSVMIKIKGASKKKESTTRLFGGSI